MSIINIKAKDLNLLVVFESLYRNQNVTKTAEELSLSQSAVSHALARLRDLFSDPLFSRLPRGIVPTPKANDLAPKISKAIEELSRIFESGDFIPEKAKGKIAIASTEYLELSLLESLFLKVRKTSPDLIFQFRNAQGKLPKLQMERGDIDIAIAGFFGNLPEGFYQQKLFENDFVCVVKKNHPLLKSKLSLETYTKLEHLLISPQGDLWGIMDEKLHSLKKTRKVRAGFENYLTPAWLVEHSDLAVTVPRTLGEYYQKILKLDLYDLPFDSPRITIVQAWHERTHRSPLHQFLRAEIKKEAENLV